MNKLDTGIEVEILNIDVIGEKWADAVKNPDINTADIEKTDRVEKLDESIANVKKPDSVDDLNTSIANIEKVDRVNK